MATVKAIKYGMKGDDVSNLQTSLKNAGYNVDVDGSFGPQTLAAVKQYQQANGLDADGMVGPQTQAKLYGNTSTPTNTSAGTNTGGAGSAASAATKVNYPAPPTYDRYVAPERVVSDNVNKAQAALNAVLAAQPGAYQSKWQSQLDDIIGRILNREAFSYDFNEDALYKQYAEQYMRGGKLAMQDTMGQAAAMTGGYGNSYASTAGNQAYQEYLSQLNAVIPELYGMALDRYQMEGQEMYNQYGLLSDQEAQDYGRYQDSYNKWLAERDYATGVYNTEEDRDYSRYMDTVDLGYRTHTDAETREWEEFIAAADKATGAQKIALDSVYTAIENGVMPSDKDIAVSGLDPHYVQELYNSYEDKATEAASEKTKAEAMDKINMYLAAGMEVPKQLQKQAGLTNDDMAALTANYQNATTEDGWEMKHVPTASFPEMEKEFNDYIDTGDLEGAESYIDHLQLADAISEDQYLKWLEIIEKKRAGATDTTVTTQKKQYPSSPGGKIIPTTTR
jgi:peptidoglycan hydrolase-like protein with peptidoglycan-binding domain